MVTSLTVFFSYYYYHYFPQSPQFNDWDSLCPPLLWLKRSQSHLNPFFKLMNSKDLVPLLIVYNKSTTEQTSMIKQIELQYFTLNTFQYHSFAKDQKRGNPGDVVPL